MAEKKMLFTNLTSEQKAMHKILSLNSQNNSEISIKTHIKKRDEFKLDNVFLENK